LILLIDNYDSFTHNLVDYLLQLGQEVIVRRNDDPDIFQANRFTGIVLSPGPGIPEHAGRLMQVIDRFHQEYPMLGICLGHQALGVYFGARLVHARYPMHGKITEMHHRETGLFSGIPAPVPVVRYHSLVLQKMPATLAITAETPEGEIMGLKHLELPLFGLQFHPEALLSAFGKQMIANWLQIIDNR